MKFLSIFCQKPRAWNLPTLQSWFQGILGTKEFARLIYCLTFITSHIYLKCNELALYIILDKKNSVYSFLYISNNVSIAKQRDECELNWEKGKLEVRQGIPLREICKNITLITQLSYWLPCRIALNWSYLIWFGIMNKDW
jgi:hypothetical protein